MTQHETRPPHDRPVVVLHVGEPKTGTTFLQQIMWANRVVLLKHGVVYPGPRGNAHWRASQDLRDIVQAPGDPVPPFTGEWDRIVDRALKAPRVGVISHELFSMTTPEQAARGLRSLEGAELHVVLTVRDIGSLLPAEWQETVKHRNAGPWRSWLSDVLDKEAPDPDRRKSMFWQAHDSMAVLENWSHGIPPEQVHVITMPRDGGGTVLWERFATLLGVDPTIVDLSTVRANASLGVPEIEMIRRLNEKLRPEFPDWSYVWFVKDTLAHGPLGLRPKAGRLTLPPERREWACAYADELISALSKSGYDIIGDLDELVPRFPDGPTPEPADAQPDDMLDAALESMTVLLARMEAMRAKAAGAMPIAADQRGHGKLKSRIIAASERHSGLHRIRRGYWHTMNAVRRLRGGKQPAATSGPKPGE